MSWKDLTPKVLLGIFIVLLSGKVFVSLNNQFDNIGEIFHRLTNRVIAETVESSVFEFSSDTYSGKKLNNPLKVILEYEDSSSYENIETIYWWWSLESGTVKDFTTPEGIAQPMVLPKTEDKENFGIMIKRNDDGNWDKVYVPHITSEHQVWLEGGTIDDDIVILSPNEKEMVIISDIQIEESGNTVRIELFNNFRHSPSIDSNVDIVESGQYDLWARINEDEWFHSEEVWSVDMVDPFVEEGSGVFDVGPGLVSLRFTLNDNISLSHVRVDACRNEGKEINPLITTYNDSYELLNCNSSDFLSDMDITQQTGTLDLLGYTDLIEESEFVLGDLQIQLNGNEGGIITFRVTGMDLAGNYVQRDFPYRLDDWISTKGGLVYGKRGVSTPTRDIDGDVWGDTHILSQYGFESLKVDITDNVLLGGHGSVSSFLGVLRGTDINESFRVGRFSGVSMMNPFLDFEQAYEGRKDKYINNYQEISTDSLSGVFSTLCDENPEYCVVKTDEDITIDTSFLCDTNGFIVTRGDIIIEPNFLNQSSEDVCILLALGDIIISPGQSVENDPVGYNVINAFLIAGGQIIIEEDGNNNGLLIEGGLVAFTKGDDEGGSIENNREISVLYKNLYPVLVVDYNPKYALLSRKLFGSQIEVFKIEIGFKPF